jgi:hypothetical protein
MGNKTADKISVRKTEQQYHFGNNWYGKLMLKYTLKKEGANSFISIRIGCGYLLFFTTMVLSVYQIT